MATLIQLRRGTSAQWNSINPVLSEGEPGYETDTHILKIGDGKTAYVDLTEVVNVESCAQVLENALLQIETSLNSSLNAIENTSNTCIQQIENTTTARPAFCVNEGRTDEDGNPNFILQSKTKIKALAPFTYTTASGISHTTDEDLWLDTSGISTGSTVYKLYVNYDGEYNLYLLDNTIYKQNTPPVSPKSNDIWLNTSVYPQISYIYTNDFWIQTDYVPLGEITQSSDLPGDEVFDESTSSETTESETSSGETEPTL